MTRTKTKRARKARAKRAASKIEIARFWRRKAAKDTYIATRALQLMLVIIAKKNYRHQDAIDAAVLANRARIEATIAKTTHLKWRHKAIEELFI